MRGGPRGPPLSFLRGVRLVARGALRYRQDVGDTTDVSQGGARMRTALVGGVLIDGTGRPAAAGLHRPRRGRQDRRGEPAARIRAGRPVVDLAGRTVMPGLIDCHAHFAHWGMNLIAHQDKSLMLLAAETVAALRTTLEVGCTTARDLGGLDAGFREAVDRGLIPGRGSSAA